MMLMVVLFYCSWSAVGLVLPTVHKTLYVILLPTICLHQIKIDKIVEDMCPARVTVHVRHVKQEIEVEWFRTGFLQSPCFMVYHL